MTLATGPNNLFPVHAVGRFDRTTADGLPSIALHSPGSWLRYPAYPLASAIPRP